MSRNGADLAVALEGGELGLGGVGDSALKPQHLAEIVIRDEVFSELVLVNFPVHDERSRQSLYDVAEGMPVEREEREDPVHRDENGCGCESPPEGRRAV